MCNGGQRADLESDAGSFVCPVEEDTNWILLLNYVIEGLFYVMKPFFYVIRFDIYVIVLLFYVIVLVDVESVFLGEIKLLFPG